MHFEPAYEDSLFPNHVAGRRTAGSIPVQAAEKAALYVLRKLDDNLNQYAGSFPGIHTDRLRYPHGDNSMWAHGFWTGMAWLAYDLTGNPKYRTAAEQQLETYESRFERKLNGKDVNDVHELGMLYTPSCVSAYKLTGNREARQLALKAAELLSRRTTASGMIYQHKLARRYRSVTDTVMNLPLLHWAHLETGDGHYRDVCVRHVRKVLEWNMREDGSVYHAVDLNLDNGELQNRVAAFSPSSCWSRGLAWGIYGLTLHYGYTGDEASLKAAIDMSIYYCSRLPSDYVCCWDLIYTGEHDQRDSSAAAIAACGMLELLKHMDGFPEQRAVIEQTVVRTLQSLTDRYLSEGEPGCSGVLLHGVYNLPLWAGVDECCLWGDYFYFEALVRCLKNWDCFW